MNANNVVRPVFCSMCGESFTAKTNNAKYCQACRQIVEQERTKAKNEKRRQSAPKSPTGKYIVVGYELGKLNFFQEEEVIPFVGRLLTKEMLRDLLPGLPPHVRIRHNKRMFITTRANKLQEVTA